MALLDGLDHTGGMVWQGAARMAQWLVDLDHRCVAAAARPLLVVPDAATGGAPPTATGTAGASTTDHIVHGVIELGAGAGLAGLAAAALLRGFAPPPPPATITPWVVLTDGNADCAALAADNLRENAAIAAPGGDAARTAGATLHWGLPAASFPPQLRALIDRAATDAADCSLAGPHPRCHHFAIVAADVIYSLEAVTPIVRTVHTVATALRDALLSASSATTRPWREPGMVAAADHNGETFTVHFLIAFYPRAWFTETNTVLFQRLCDGLTEPEAYFAAQRQVLQQLAEDARVVEQLVGQPTPTLNAAPSAPSVAAGAYQTPVEVAAAALRDAKKLEMDTSAAEVAAISRWVPWRVRRQEVAEAPESSGVEPGREGSLLHFELCIATR
jgi:hypothetical protein